MHFFWGTSNSAGDTRHKYCGERQLCQRRFAKRGRPHLAASLFHKTTCAPDRNHSTHPPNRGATPREGPRGPVRRERTADCTPIDDETTLMGVVSTSCTESLSLKSAVSSVRTQ